MSFLANFINFPASQKFWKSVKTWQSYRQFKGENFFDTQRRYEPKSGRGAAVRPRQVSSWSIEQFGHNTPKLQTDRQSDSIGRTKAWSHLFFIYHWHNVQWFLCAGSPIPVFYAGSSKPILQPTTFASILFNKFSIHHSHTICPNPERTPMDNWDQKEICINKVSIM